MNELLHKHADEMRDMWQSRVLRTSEGMFRSVLIAIFAEAYPNALKILLEVTFPGFTDLDRPFLHGYAMIMPSGAIVCRAMFDDGDHIVEVYENQGELIWDARTLADKLKLPDKDRIQMFDLLQKWIAADRRVGVNGQKLAS